MPESSKTTIVKQKTRKESKAKKNITLMVLIVSCAFTLANLPSALFNCFKAFNFLDENFILSTISRSFLYMLVIIKFFIFFLFNKLYRKILFSKIKNLKKKHKK